MPADQHGLEMTAAGPAAVELYDRAVAELGHYGPAMLRLPEEACLEDPACPLAGALRAYLCLLTTEPDDVEAGRAIVEDLRARVPEEGMLPRERGHLRVADSLIAGDLLGAGRLLRELTREHPRDLLALYVGHNLDFFTGDALALRDRVAEVLPAWSAEDAAYGLVLGMHAFGLEEAGDYPRAEEAGLRALELDPKDVWAIHAVVHTYEMQARFGEGLAVKMCDASALLWRLLLDGVDAGPRWQALAEVWERLLDRPWYAFNDMHAAMAFAGAGDVARAEALVADRERYLAEPRPGATNYAITARIGLPVCRAIVAFGRERYGEAVDQLMPIRHYLNELGGSHAQRDAVLRTLLEAAIRGRRRDAAELLLAERITVKPGSPYNWLKRAELERSAGGEGGAAEAERRARELVRASGTAPGDARRGAAPA